ncbi:hypothetical protein D3879_22695 [Pseudomonas cavernicola]|uniref:Uncharacterized protein n=1 Tax=Pseudomonas cavernicola TaxID=2320866 RepID=A0A418X8C3_9PSED|nr:hypothetical protein [Pseudomonas cavernicola]RJG08700.1 hypothetical protein D3879_22695 [Pseudomonas cavernicola]
MSQKPTAEEFLSLSEAASRYHYMIRECLNVVFREVQQGKLTGAEITDLVERSVEAHEMAHEASLGVEGVCALKWLEKQAHFCVAKKAANFKDDDPGWPTKFESIIRYWNDSKYSSRSPYLSVSHEYLDFVSGVGGAAYGYMSGQSLREALNGANTLEEIKSRLLEVESLLAACMLSKSLSAHISDALQIERAVGILDSEAPLITPVSCRNDANLPARLMASELIWHYERKFGEPLIDAVFQLLGLFFENENQLEKRTLQRLAAQVNKQAERREEIYLEQGRIEEERLAAMVPARTQREAFARLENERFRAAYERMPSMKP